MPIEIRELHIRVNVSEEPGASSASGRAPAPSGGDKAADWRDRLLGQCIDEVTALLERKKER